MSQTPIQTTYPAGKILQITAQPTVTIADKQYTFLQWEDRSTTTTRNITMNSNLTLAATYVTPSQAGFPLWAIPVAAGAVIIMYFMRDNDKKKKR